MCVMSVVMDYGKQWLQPFTIGPPVQPVPTVSPDSIRAFEELLRKAKEYDRITGQPDCELEPKKRILQEMADVLKITIKFPE